MKRTTWKRMRFSRGVKNRNPREVTQRRIANAERALKRQRDKLPLFADQIAAEQPTAEERCRGFDDGLYKFWQEHRDLEARMWRECRRAISVMPELDRKTLMVQWNQSNWPGNSVYFSVFLRTRLQQIRDALAAGERWFCVRVDTEYRIILFDPRAVALMIERRQTEGDRWQGPFDTFEEALAASGERT